MFEGKLKYHKHGLLIQIFFIYFKVLWKENRFNIQISNKSYFEWLKYSPESLVSRSSFVKDFFSLISWRIVLNVHLILLMILPVMAVMYRYISKVV